MADNSVADAKSYLETQGVQDKLTAAVKQCISERPADAAARIVEILIAQPKPADPVKVFGLPASMNCVGPILLAQDAEVGSMEMCNIMEGAQNTTEFLAINPYHHVPALADGDVKIGESNAILRYLAMKYKPALYPVADPGKCAMIDFAIDAFANEVYKGHVGVVYPVFKYTAAPADFTEANAKYTEEIDRWCKHFLADGEKFVAGDSVTIADFKAVPFFFAASLPGVTKVAGFTLPERASKYIADFMAAVPSAEFMKSAGGYSLAEYCETVTK